MWCQPFEIRSDMMLHVISTLCFLVVLVTGQDQSMRLSEANTRFALDTYQQLAAEYGNVFFSPLSISVVLGMLYAGSNGATKTQMENVANFDLVKDLSSSFCELSSILNADSKNYTLRAANKIYANDKYPFLPDYLRTLQNDYQSDIVASDFASNAEMVRTQINDWVSKTTMGKIKDLIPKNSLTRFTQMVLVNALYFKGAWQKKFNAKLTNSKRFYHSVGQSVLTDMMTQKGKFRLAANRLKGYQALELPYSGKDLSMFVVLPDAIDDLAGVEKQMTFDEIRNIHTNLGAQREREVTVTLPKFKIEQKYTLNSYLSKMGLDNLFKKRVCDLSGMDGRTTNRLLYVSKIFHKCFVEVNEEGSEAAAATGAVVAVITSVVWPPPKPLTFRADHPFLFYIKDNRSDSILFMGRYVKP